MYSSILVPLDGSNRAEKILPHVEEIARRYEARIIFLQVVEPPPMPTEGATITYGHEYEKIHSLAEKYLSDLVMKFQTKNIHAEKRLENGHVVGSILRTSESMGVDLIAIASHGRGGLSRVFYGSVAASLLQHVDRPLLLIRSRKE
jgi:nucleotide-binding universal stress UspA family protein